MAHEVFNKCTEIAKTGDDECVTLYYEFLDDTYSKWNTEQKVNYIQDSELTAESLFLDIFFTDEKSSTRELDKRENHPLAIMVSYE